MLVLWRRHIRDCSHRDDGRDHLKCRCPIWLDWRIGGKRVREPLNTRDWQAAQMRARQLEADGITSEVAPQTLEQVSKRFLNDAKARGLREASLYKYQLVLKQLQTFGISTALFSYPVLAPKSCGRFVIHGRTRIYPPARSLNT